MIESSEHEPGVELSEHKLALAQLGALELAATRDWQDAALGRRELDEVFEARVQAGEDREQLERARILFRPYDSLEQHRLVEALLLEQDRAVCQPSTAGQPRVIGSSKRRWLLVGSFSLAAAVVLGFMVFSEPVPSSKFSPPSAPEPIVSFPNPVKPDLVNTPPPPLESTYSQPRLQEGGVIVHDGNSPWSQSPECVKHRERAMSALEGGHWAALEVLTGRRYCFPTDSEAIALQMRALFELGRFEECVRLGLKSKGYLRGSNEMQTWASACQRALE